MLNRNFWDLISKVVVAILTIYSLFTMPVDIVDKTKSKPLGIVISAIAITCIIVAAIYYFFPPALLKRFGVMRHKVRAIVLESLVVIDIDSAYVATIKKSRKVVYPSIPPPEDLYDLIEVAANELIDEKVYVTEDSSPLTFVRNKSNQLTIFWQPNKPIIPNTIYHHQRGYRSPSLYGDDGFWHSTMIDQDTGIINHIFKSVHPIVFAIAFRMPKYSSRIRMKKLDRLAFIVNRRDCAQPQISDDKKTITWDLINPIKYRSYVCFAFYEGGVEAFRKTIKRNWVERIILKLRYSTFINPKTSFSA